MTEPTWRKARRSANTNSCIEIRGDLGALRDSKNLGPTLVVPTASVAALITTAIGRP